jgi:hypothetical protein
MAVGSVQLAQRRPAILNIPEIFGERNEGEANSKWQLALSLRQLAVDALATGQVSESDFCHTDRRLPLGFFSLANC